MRDRRAYLVRRNAVGPALTATDGGRPHRAEQAPYRRRTRVAEDVVGRRHRRHLIGGSLHHATRRADGRQQVAEAGRVERHALRHASGSNRARDHSRFSFQGGRRSTRNSALAFPAGFRGRCTPSSGILQTAESRAVEAHTFVVPCAFQAPPRPARFTLHCSGLRAELADVQPVTGRNACHSAGALLRSIRGGVSASVFGR